MFVCNGRYEIDVVCAPLTGTIANVEHGKVYESKTACRNDNPDAGIIYGFSVKLVDKDNNAYPEDDIPEWFGSLGEAMKWCQSWKSRIRYVRTNIGCIPVEDYREIKAHQYGFESYAQLRASGCCLDDVDGDVDTSDSIRFDASDNIK